MGTREENMASALEAIRFVKAKMKYGAKNKVKDIYRSRGNSISCLDEVRANIDRHYENTLKDLFEINQNAAGEREAEYTASAAAHFGCGNCNEQAALAFIYLRDKGIFPLDWVNKLNDFLIFGGHSFVIGREYGKLKPAEWGQNAVICDPHGAETAFPASDFEKYMPNAKLTGKLRLDKKSSSTIKVAFD